MQWYYEKDGRPEGPVDDETFNALVAQQVIGPETRVWNPDLPDWRPFAEAAAGDGTAPWGAPEIRFTCAECGESKPAQDVIPFGSVHVCGACKPVFFRRMKQGTLYSLTRSYAGFWIRACAKFLDYVITGAVQTCLQVTLYSIVGFEDPIGVVAVSVLMALGSFVLVIVYNSWFVGRFAATPGKMACGLKVILSDGSKVRYGRAIGRAFAEIVSGVILNIGYLIAAFDEQKRALHDHMCDTRVVRV